MIALSAAVAAVAVVLALPVISDAASLVRAAHRRRRPAQGPSGDPPRFLFLVPAHDEAVLIESCVRSLLGQRYPRDRYTVIVVADNCADRTAERARGAGAACLERREPARPGKPQAVAWALDRVDLGGYDLVTIVDADSVVDPEFAAALARAAGPDGAAQPFNDVRNPADSAVTRMAAVMAAGRFRGAFRLKARAGLNVPFGAGMTLPARLLRARGWNAFSIGEDWEWYATLTAAGVPIAFAPDAHLYAQEARSMREGWSQRRRWLAGRINVLARFGPRILRNPRIAWRQKLDALAEMSAPGPVVQLGLVTLLGGGSLALGLPGAPALAALLAVSLAAPVAYAAVGVATDAVPARAARAFLYLPVYAVWRLAAAAAALTAVGDRRWVRARRE